MTPTPYGWQDDAACRGLTDLFFPAWHETEHQQEQREAEAQLVCAGCKVITHCRTWLAEEGHRQDAAVAAGTTPAERGRDRRAARRNRSLFDPTEFDRQPEPDPVPTPEPVLLHLRTRCSFEDEPLPEVATIDAASAEVDALIAAHHEEDELLASLPMALFDLEVVDAHHAENEQLARMVWPNRSWAS